MQNKEIRDIIEIVTFIKDRMITRDEAATKDDLKRFATKDEVRAIIQEEVPGIVALELRPIYHELKDINRRLDLLEAQFGNPKGVTKEIDDLRAQVRAIQKHLGIDKQIAA